jgi:hypothetical protein
MSTLTTSFMLGLPDGCFFVHSSASCTALLIAAKLDPCSVSLSAGSTVSITAPLSLFVSTCVVK